MSRKKKKIWLKLNRRTADDLASKVQDFYRKDISREMPNATDVIKVNAQPVPKHLCQVNQRVRFQLFQEKYPNSKIGQRTFDSI